MTKFYLWGIIGVLIGIMGVSTIQNGEINWVLVLLTSAIWLINHKEMEKDH
ncbi:MAG TPA: hypothetical protein VK135_02125 [Candidatus Dormibacteraeota bacterium]|nr:hypothetical protein [Candidatus Dormibacteraeota bacterium]